MDLLRLEEQRQTLEQNLQSLRASLKHWQTVSAEYEGIKEEVEASSDDLDLEAITQDHRGDAVHATDIHDLTGLPNNPRTGPQIVGIISRRQEYVQKNIEALQRQFWDAESKLEELDFAAISANRQDGGHLPLTEIHEELDEEGNVVSSRLLQPEVATTNIVDALRQVGLSEKQLAGEEGGSTRANAPDAPPSALVNSKAKPASDVPASTRNAALQSDAESGRPPVRKKSVSFTADTKVAPEPVRQETEDGKKTVSFNDKVAVMPAAPAPDNRSVSFSPQVEEIPAGPITPAQEVSPELKQARDEMQRRLREFMFKPGERVGEINDEDELANTHVVIPEHESEVDAAARREMLEYSLNEVGHVVAQMDLDEDDFDGEETGSASDFTSSEHLDEDTPYTSGLSDSEVDSEDEFGRTKHRVISDDYHKEMQELERKLIGNLGPAPQQEDVAMLDSEIDASDVHRLVIRDNAVDHQTQPAIAKKHVSFAEALEEQSPVLSEHENAAPVVETVRERSSSVVADPPKRTLSRVTRFKRTHVPAPANESEGDFSGTASGMLIADQLIERPTRRKSAMAPSENDADPIMQRRELAAEYYRRRNEFIRQQGGFKASVGEDDGNEMVEERDGQLRKVSRFKAARIKR